MSRKKNAYMSPLKKNLTPSPTRPKSKGQVASSNQLASIIERLHNHQNQTKEMKMKMLADEKEYDLR